MNFQVRFFAWLLLIVFTTSSHSLAGEKIKRSTTKVYTPERYTTTRHATYDTTYSADSIAADILIARPCWFVETVVGAGLFVVSLPFSAASRSVNKTAHSLVIRPGRATFRRTPGDFSTIE